MLVAKQCIMALQSNLLFSGVKETSVNIALLKIGNTCSSGGRMDLLFQLYKGWKIQIPLFQVSHQQKESNL